MPDLGEVSGVIQDRYTRHLEVVGISSLPNGRAFTLVRDRSNAALYALSDTVELRTLARQLGI